MHAHIYVVAFLQHKLLTFISLLLYMYLFRKHCYRQPIDEFADLIKKMIVTIE